MEFQGIKVRTVNPGSVSYNNDKRTFYFTVQVNGFYHPDTEEYNSASAAKAAMREEVRRLKRIHLIGE